jgi:hypothetical protein
MDIPDALKSAAASPVVSTLDGWCGAASNVDLAAADRDLLDLALYVYPDLRATAYLGQVARDRDLRYPVTHLEQILDALEGARIEIGEIVVDEVAVSDALREEPFPLNHEGELLSAIHRAIVRCRGQATLRRHAAARLDQVSIEDGRRSRT